MSRIENPKSRKSVITLIPLFLILFGTNLAFGALTPEPNKQVLEKAFKIQMPFIENKGQISDEHVRFYSKIFGGTVFVTDKGEMVYSLIRTEPTSTPSLGKRHKRTETITKTWALKEELTGATINIPKGMDKAQTKVNYFIGNNKDKWKTDLTTYNVVNLGDVYKGIDLSLKAYGKNVEKIFTVKPGADPKSISLKVEGANSLNINDKGELEVQTGIGTVSFAKPIAYQEINGKRHEVNARYELVNSELETRNSQLVYGFKTGAYDKSHPLIIDPLLGSTFLGGTSNDYGNAVAIDGSGNVFVTGYTNSSGFPRTTGSYSGYVGGEDVFISKFDANLSTLSASTFLGGTSNERAWTIAIDGSGNVYVSGWTSSIDYPIILATAYQHTNAGGYCDVFISKLSGNLDQLLASTYLGGTDTDDVGGSLAIDSSGNVYVVGDTLSTDFPVTTGVLKQADYDAFVSKFDSNLSDLLASTLIAGDGTDDGNGIAIFDFLGIGELVYVVGSTSSTNFPLPPFGHWTNNGNFDAFVAMFTSDDLILSASTLLGGTGSEAAFSIAISGFDIFVGGYTTSSDFPTTAGAYDTTYNGGSFDGFVAKFNGDLSELQASTFIGGSSGGSMNEFILSIAVDSAGNVFVAGYTHADTFPTTPGAYQMSISSTSYEAFVSKLSNDLTQLLASTFLGGTGDDDAYGLAIDATGNVLIVGSTDSSDFPVTSNAPYQTFGGGMDAFVAKLDSNLSACTYSISPTIHYYPSGGGSGSVSVTAPAGCDWTAVRNVDADPWVTITSGASGSGNGTVNYSVAENTGGARTGTMTIAGQTFTVNQAASPPPDLDGDGIPDTWEDANCPGGNCDPSVDLDGDGLTNLQEYQAGTNPLSSDTDGDGIPDGTDNCPKIYSPDNSCLLGWWRFDECSDTTAFDSSGHGNHGYLDGSVSFSTDAVMGCASNFAVKEGIIRMYYSSTLEPVTGTIGLWVKLDALQNADILNKLTNKLVRTGVGEGGSVFGLRIFEDGPIFVPGAFVMNDDPTTPGSPWRAVYSRDPITAGEWHHLAMRWDGSKVAIFVDGVLRDETPYNPVPGTGLSYYGPMLYGFFLGNETSWGPPYTPEFLGKLDDVRFYGRALTDAEIYNHFTMDTDMDGIPDGWEVTYGLNPLVNDAALDPDGDGLTNLQEYQQGTNPNSPNTTYSLVVTKLGTGTGKVTSSPAGINCGSDCSEIYAMGTTVTLRAWANPGSYFVGWSGVASCPGIGPCTTTITGATTVNAQFQKGAVSAGGNHTLAIKSDGTLWAWGESESGQIGDGTQTLKYSPVQIGSDTWVSVSTGGYHSVGVKSDGTLWAWGRAGLTTDSATPAQVGSESDWVAVSAGAASCHTAALKSNGTLWAWGCNGYGQLGVGDTTNRNFPVPVGSDTDWVAISVGWGHTAAIKSDGTLWAWGYNGYGQLGYSTLPADYSSIPTRVETDTDWVSVSAGYNSTMAVKSDGTLWGWGWNPYGMMGDGTINGYSSPTRIGTHTDWVSVSVGVYHTIALKSDRTLWASGHNDYGQLADGTKVRRLYLDIGGDGNGDGFPDTDWVLIASGNYHAVALKSDGTLWTWGRNSNGQLGDGIPPYSPILVQTGDADKNGTPDTDWASISAGAAHSGAIKLDGTLWTWGTNYYSQLGTGSQLFAVYSPAQVSGTGWSSVSAGHLHTMAIKTDRTLWAWGHNGYGQYGNGTLNFSAIPVQTGDADGTGGPDTDWTSVSTGFVHTVALKLNGTLWAWGSNAYGQLGDGSTTQRNSPVQLASVQPWIAVSTGTDHTIALKSDGTLWAWGKNESGQLGVGDTTNRYSPVQVGSDIDWASISAGWNYTVALKTNGTLWMWGNNTLVPTEVGTDTDWAEVSAGGYHIVALKMDGTLWTNGNNTYGSLGDGTALNRYSFAQVGTDSDWVAISANGPHTLALKSDGTLWAWGWNGDGQLGTGDEALSTVPVQVSLVSDTDGDGLPDIWEYANFGLLAQGALDDPDGDGMPNSWEFTYGLNPLNPSDAALDSDGDGLTNLQEYQLGTDPTKIDTGLDDDGDGFTNLQEFQAGTNAQDPNSKPTWPNFLLVNYEGNVLPENNPTYPFGLVGGKYTPTTDGSFLHMNKSAAYAGSLNRMFYYRNEVINQWDSVTVEFRMRVNAPPNVDKTDTLKVEVVDGTKTIWLGFTNHSIGLVRPLWTYPFPSQYTVEYDTTNFHTYRLVKNGNTGVQVYADGVLVIDFPYLSLDGPIVFSSRIGFGTDSMGYTSDSYWDYFRYSITTQDSDGDGMADAWETAKGVTDPSGNPDADSANNLQEYQAQTDPNSNTSYPVVENTEWSGTKVVDRIVVMPGVTLTLNPVTTIKFLNSTSGMTVYGTLDAQGTATQPIIFTTNTLSPTPAKWNGLFFDGTMGEGIGIFDYCQIEYANFGVFAENSKSLTIERSNITNCGSGFHVRSYKNLGPVLINNNTFQVSSIIGNMYFPEYSGGFLAGPLSFNGNTGTAGPPNYWYSGPYLFFGADIGVNATLSNIGGLPILVRGIAVNPGVTLDIIPGTTLKFEGVGSSIKAMGVLNAIGTPEEPITFTSSKPTPQKGDWVGINTWGYPGPITLEHCIIEYAQTAVLTGWTQVTLRNSTFRHLPGDGLYLLDRTPYYTEYHAIVDHCIFEDIDGHGIIDGGADVTITDSTFRNCALAATPETPKAAITFGRIGTMDVFRSTITESYMGIDFCCGSTPTIGGSPENANNISGNTAYGIRNNNSPTTADATYNWWGNASGPSGVGSGSGDAVTAGVTYDPWIGKTADADGDGLDDAWEMENFGNLSQEASGDPDGDGFTNLQEFNLGTNPNSPDTDSDLDGLPDSWEIAYGTNPNDSDTDDDGLTDGQEVNVYLTDPLNWDSDGDGISDGDEVAAGSQPTSVDSDEDGIPDDEDVCPGDWANDYDGDGICAGTGYRSPKTGDRDNCPWHANPDQLDSDFDGKGDACDWDISGEQPNCGVGNKPPCPVSDDADGDGLTTAQEASYGTDPNNPDTDGDGVLDGADNCKLVANNNQTNTDGDAFGDACDPDDDNDGWDDGVDNCPLVANSSQADMDNDGVGDACDSDIDGDTWSNDYEASQGTSPTNPDTDGDGTPDNLDPDPLVPSNSYRVAFEVLGLDAWLPTPTWNQQSQKWIPNQITVVAKFYNPFNTPINFTNPATVELYPSFWEGVATNDTEQYTVNPSNDMSFSATDTNDITREFPLNTETISLTVFAFDFGGQATLKVTTTDPNGQIVQGTISLPKDSDQDGLPDKWEIDHSAIADGGFGALNAFSLGRSVNDGQADIDTSLDNTYHGDGLSNFKEYRGVIKDTPVDVGNPLGPVIYTHERLSPTKKDLFVRGDNFANSIPPSSAPGVLPFRIDHQNVYATQGGGVNAFEEAGIKVHDVTGMPSFRGPAEPPNIDILVVTNKTVRNTDNLIETLLGYENGTINHPSTTNIRYWEWDLKGASYIGDAELYAVLRDASGNPVRQATETYHLCLMHYIWNRPYIDELAQGACATGTTYQGKLDPLGKVEDWLVENGTNPPNSSGKKKEDRCGLNGILDGDRMDPNWKNYTYGTEEWKVGLQLSVFDADNDGLVENPRVDDPLQITKEYNPQMLQLHTVIHEMGHGVGCDENHTTDNTCVMYVSSPDWDRADHFSSYARGQIIIHNKTE